MWLQPEQSIRDALVTFYGKRIDKARSIAEGDSSHVAGSPRVKNEQVQLQPMNIANRSKFAMFGPRLSQMVMSSSSRVSTSRDQAELDISAYEKYHMGYTIVAGGGVAVGEDAQFNENLKSKYDDDPRVFWSDKKHTRAMGDSLARFSTYIFSILAGSAGPEREFSRMGYLVTTRRSRYTAGNANKRLTLANLIPQKRRLEKALSSRQIKRSKLFDNNTN